MSNNLSMENKTQEILNNLSEEERKVALEILKEYSEKGESKKFTNLLYADYKEIPVDIETFINDDNYLGKAWKDSYGKLKLYDYWMSVLKEIFPNNLDTDYEILLESGARGLGKSEIAAGIVCPYLMYRVMCLKNPLEYYHIKLTEKIAFAFMNIKLDLSKKIAIDKFQKTIQMSPWFTSKGSMTQFENQPYWVPPAPIEIIIGSQSDDVIGRPIFYAFFDEVSFFKNKDVEEQKKKALDMINTAIGGMKTRFIHKGKNPTLLVVASSKKSEQSFMETYMRDLAETEPESTYIVDKAVWEVKPKGTYKDTYFYVGLGNKTLDNRVIPDEDSTPEKLKLYENKGYQIIKVPEDFKALAKRNPDRVLRDYAGISLFSANKFMSSERISDCVVLDYSNPLPDKIVCGIGDDEEYSDFFDKNKIQKQYMDKPLFIHLDMSYSEDGDKTGIAGVWIVGKKPTSDGNPGKDLMYKVAFSTSIEAPTGRQISFEKNRNFVRWLKAAGFKIKEITSDAFQSADTGQQLSSEGFNYNQLSVDRVESIPGEKGGICRPYEYLKNTIYEKRLIMYETDLLHTELVQLEKDNSTGKVDHPSKGSKDQADALCGATFTASKHADEFSFEYGEDLSVVSDLNTTVDRREQMIVDFNEELQKTFDPFANMERPKPKQEDNIPSAFVSGSSLIW